MSEHVVGDLTFKNQLDLKAYVKNILSRNLNSVLKEGYDFEFLSQFFSRHPEWEEKRGSGVLAYKISSNLGSYHVDILHTDGTSIDISWNTAVRGRGRTAHGDLMREYRESIAEQIRHFRASSGWLTVCPRCSEKLSSAPHVDHAVSFRTLVKQFEESEESDFARFHQKHAKLQFICSACNFKKGTLDEMV